MEKIEQLQKQLIKLGKKLNKKNMLSACDGNLSFRVSDEEIWITPSGKGKVFLSSKELCKINIKGEVFRGQPSGERKLHLRIYEKCALAGAVIHAHPPKTTALSVAFPEWTEIPLGALSEVILAAGKIPIMPYQLPGSEALADQLNEHLPQCRLLVMGRHGAVSWGESLEEAYYGMERLEHTSEILTTALSLGPLKPLPQQQINELKQLREQIGERLL